MENPSIEITNVGPIEAVSIPIPVDGGVVVLRGPNGVGKTIALSAVDALTREGKASPGARARDGSLGGSIEGLGRQIKVGLQRSTSRGELEVTALADGVDIGAMVDPGFSEAGAADRARIKAALLLARIAVDVEPFAELVGGIERLKVLVRADALAATDPVEMAARVRRDLHAKALDLERQADAREATAKGLREATGNANLKLDEAAIRAESEDAVAHKRALEERAKLAAANLAKRAAAQKAIDASGMAADLEAASAAHARAQGTLAAAAAKVEEAQREHVAAAAAASAVVDRLHAARAAAQKLDEARKMMDAASAIEAPGEEELALANARVIAAHEQAAKLGAAAEARKQLFAANIAAEEAKQARVESDELRDAAKATDEVLAKLLAGFAPAGLGIYDGRLVLRVGERHKYFADLSDGERWRIALDMAIDALGDARILAISQLAWEGLDHDARAAIHAHAKARRTVIVTAEADKTEMGELRAEVLS